MQQENLVQTIIDQIIVAANLGGLPEAEEGQFRENMEAQINRRLGLIIINNLDEKGLAAYEKLTKSGTVPAAAEMQNFLQEYLPDYEDKVRDGMKEFIKETIMAGAK